MENAPVPVSPTLDITTLKDVARTLRTVREEAYATGSLPDDRGEMRPVWPVGLTKDRGEALGAMARHAGAKRVLEIGLGLGLSTSFLLEAAALNVAESGGEDADGVLVTSIDPGAETISGNAGLRLIDRSGAGRVHRLINEASQIAMPRLVSAEARFDLVFVDGDHRFDGTFVDVYFALRLAPGGLVVLDDAWMPAVTKASRFFVDNGLCEREAVFESGGKHRLHALRVRAGHGERAWDHFVDF